MPLGYIDTQLQTQELQDYDLQGNPIIEQDVDPDKKDAFDWIKKLGESDLFAKGGLLSDIIGAVKKDQPGMVAPGATTPDTKADDSKKGFIIIAVVVIGLMFLIGTALLIMRGRKK